MKRGNPAKPERESAKDEKQEHAASWMKMKKGKGSKSCK